MGGVRKTSAMKKIGLITNASEYSGVGSRAYQLFRHIGKQDDIEVTLVNLDGKDRRIPLLTKEGVGEVSRSAGKQLVKLPGFLGSKSVSWIRLAKGIPEFDMYDLTNQSLSFIAKKRHPSIVTVHDLFELTDPQDSRAYLLNKYLLSGITRTEKIVAVSEFTKKSIQEYFGIPESKISVIHNGVDGEYTHIPHFSSSLRYQELMHGYKLQGKSPILLYVGSESPRKNLKTVLETVASIKKQYPGVVLLKVGDAGMPAFRKNTLEIIDRLHLKSSVLFIGKVPNVQLNELYNIADALLFPSLLEGFGMTPLEAMSAGCPAICSNGTAVPEVVGSGGIMHDPHDADAFAKSVVHIVTNTEFRETVIEAGKQRAAMFSWSKAANQTLELYRAAE